MTTKVIQAWKAERPPSNGLRLPIAPGWRVLASAALLVAFWLSLPVRLERSADAPSGDTCLTLADQPPAEGAVSLSFLERCAVLVPDDVELMADLGAVYEIAGRIVDAEQVYRRALQHDPEYADLQHRLARLLLRKGAVGEARIHAEAALRLQPNRRAVLDILSEVSRLEAGGEP